jgi:hypothetical protein
MEHFIMDTGKAIEFLERGEYIGLLLPQRPDLDILCATEVLIRMAEKRKKAVGLFYDIEFSAVLSSGAFPMLEKTSRLPKEFIVSLDTTQSPASELRYEKGDDRIDIIFSPRSQSIQREHISFRDGKLQCDVIVALGVRDIDSVSALVKDDPDIFTRTPIINIDSSKENTNFGEVNLLEERPSAEIVYLLLSSMEKAPPEKEEATLLLAGILSATHQLRSPRIVPETLLSVSELIRAGAQFDEALELSKERKPLAFIQLTGRAQVRSKGDVNERIVWLFLTAEDYEKTGRTDDDALDVLEALSRELSWGRALVLLSQHPTTLRIQALIAGNQALLGSIAETAEGEWRNQFLSLPNSFETFKEAEDHIRSLLG